VIGILTGWGLAALVTRFANISTTVSIESVLIAVAVCAGIGIVFGYYRRGGRRA